MRHKTQFVIYKDRAKEWRGRLQAGNGETVTISESYKRKYDALRWARRLRLQIRDACLIVED